jgi:hypothetical protein
LNEISQFFNNVVSLQNRRPATGDRQQAKDSMKFLLLWTFSLMPDARCHSLGLTGFDSMRGGM